MSDKFLELTVTDSVRAAQRHYYGGEMRPGHTAEADALSGDEIAFIQARDSFYLSTVSEAGWPYVQHRGGAPGFLHVLSPTRLAFADYRGNRQLLSTGNLAANNRVCLFLMDYPQRTRLKVLGHAWVEDARQHPDVVERLDTVLEASTEFATEFPRIRVNRPNDSTKQRAIAHAPPLTLPLSPPRGEGIENSVKMRPGLVERIFFIDVASFSWNCSQHITPRFTADEVEAAVAPLRRQIAELEQQLKG